MIGQATLDVQSNVTPEPEGAASVELRITKRRPNYKRYVLAPVAAATIVVNFSATPGFANSAMLGPFEPDIKQATMGSSYERLSQSTAIDDEDSEWVEEIVVAPIARPILFFAQYHIVPIVAREKPFIGVQNLLLDQEEE